ncbi:T9SS type A sorting domain-containing protein [Adhaeribacter terreus]|uniref:T9SS type A sorting domain-containing protein n=1 Tax=Adhaeribacter terreus TaxID=529703 RepID=A0ABW0EFM0_9BACT
MKKNLSFLLLFLVCNLSMFAQGNTPPGRSFTLNNLPKNDTSIIELFPGDTMNLVLNTYDPNITDSVRVTSNIMAVLAGATFSVNNAKQQTAYFNWIPAATDVNLEPYTVLVKIEDNAVPIKGVINFHVKIRVNKPGNISLNIARVDLNQEIQLQPGSSFNFRLSSINAGSGNAVSIISNAATVLPGAAFTTDNGLQQTATINWTPTAAHVKPGAYVFTLTLQENSSPTPKQYVYTVRLRVGNIMSVKDENEAFRTFTAYPNPYSQHLDFRFNNTNKAENLVIYNLLGEMVDAISLMNAAPGEQKVPWQNADKFATGTYVAKLISANKTIQTLKFTKLQ